MTELLREAEILAPGEGAVVPLPGATMVFKALSGLGASDFLVAEFTAEPGFAGPRPHVHRVHEELFYVLAGEFDFFLEDQTVRVAAGAFVAVRPGVMHDFRNAGAGPARWLGIVAPGGLERYFSEVHKLAVAGQLTDARRRELRLRYDTEEPDAIPAGHWAAPAEHETHEIGDEQTIDDGATCQLGIESPPLVRDLSGTGLLTARSGVIRKEASSIQHCGCSQVVCGEQPC